MNDFAVRCFSEIADGDYVAARMANRAALAVQYLWASQQAIEKYLKCILLLNRIAAKEVQHDLGAALSAIDTSGKLALDLTRPTQEFIKYLDTYGRFRYLEISHFASGRSIIMLDRAVWELRRFCTLDLASHQIKLRHDFPAPKVRLPGGRLEEIIDTPGHPAREPLLWQNAFFGKRVRRRVKVNAWREATNSPLSLNPQILDEVVKYVHLSKELQKAYRTHTKPK